MLPTAFNLLIFKDTFGVRGVGGTKKWFQDLCYTGKQHLNNTILYCLFKSIKLTKLTFKFAFQDMIYLEKYDVTFLPKKSTLVILERKQNCLQSSFMDKTSKVYNLFQDPWNWFIILEGGQRVHANRQTGLMEGWYKVPLVPRLRK